MRGHFEQFKFTQKIMEDVPLSSENMDSKWLLCGCDGIDNGKIIFCPFCKSKNGKKSLYAYCLYYYEVEW